MNSAEKFIREDLRPYLIEMAYQNMRDVAQKAVYFIDKHEHKWATPKSPDIMQAIKKQFDNGAFTKEIVKEPPKEIEPLDLFKGMNFDQTQE